NILLSGSKKCAVILKAREDNECRYCGRNLPVGNSDVITFCMRPGPGSGWRRHVWHRAPVWKYSANKINALPT
ncbi:hypothetical protein, partial [Serratia marcescens]|uniref:hypothetical protein n=1 Tax=Serratia marcescens TaxID=615 RepID=UPI002FD8FF4A